MGEAIGESLPLAIGIALSPIPIVGVVLMLGTPRGRVNGPAFVAGWMAGLSAVGAVVLILGAGADASEGGQPADWASVLKLVLGVFLLVVASRQWRGRPRDGEQAELPKWLQAVDHIRPARAAALALALSLNPKNLVLLLAAAVAISQTGVSGGDQAIALAVFVIVATLGPGLPVAIYFALGDRSRELLDRMRVWMTAHSGAILAVICLVIAAKLIGDGISGLSG